MHSKRRYKICNCSVILGKLESFLIYKGFSINYLPDNFRCNVTFYESEKFSICIFESENFRFPFSTKNSPALVVKCEKKNVHSENRNRTGVQKFLAVLNQ